jgi:hypothetical protein
MHRARKRRVLVGSIATVVVVSGALVAGIPAQAARPHRGAAVATAPPSITGLPPVVPPVAAAPQPMPKPLPRKTGSVPLQRTLKIAPSLPGRQPSSGTTKPNTVSPNAVSPKVASPNAVSPNAAAPATATTNKVALRALIVAVDGDDFGLATWKTTLDRVGAAYDVLLSRTTPLTAASLVRPDGTGRYDAILLTNSSLLYADGGGYVSGFDGTEWNTLWAYERDYAIRQAVLYGSYGTFPENYCLTGSSEGGVGDTALNTKLTTAGAQIFDYLKPTAQIPLVQSYVYHTAVTAGCAATPVLTAGTDVLGVTSTSTDGRQRMELTFTSNQYLLQSDLLVYGLFRWASRGLFLGEQRHYLNVDVDDWFNTADERLPDGTINSDPGWSMSAHDAYNAYLQQTAIHTQYPLASTFTLGMAFNGGDADLTAGKTCSPNGTVAQLTATSRCLASKFRWINHSVTHPKMNFTDYATSLSEITGNLTIAQQLGLPVDKTVFKSPEYSGLGTYNPDPNDDIDPPTDYGLMASNPAMLQAAKDAGVKYLHGNMSFGSQQPSCFDCGIPHPMQPSLMIVPDWPTNVAYFSTTPDEETSFYNFYYGPGGKFPYWPTNLTYAQAMSADTDIALGHLSSGSIYTHTFHIANLRDYGGGKTLLFDWVSSLLGKYSSYYKVPVLNPGWPALAQYSASRNSHFAELAAGVDAVFDRTANTVTVTSPAAGTVTVSGARTSGFTTYGTDVSASLTLTAGGSVVFTPSLRP